MLTKIPIILKFLIKRFKFIIKFLNKFNLYKSLVDYTTVSNFLSKPSINSTNIPEDILSIDIYSRNPKLPVFNINRNRIPSTSNINTEVQGFNNFDIDLDKTPYIDLDKTPKRYYIELDQDITDWN